MTNIKKLLKEYFFIASGSLLISLGINCFLLPCKISTGGVSGLATVIYYFFKLPVSVTALIINAVLFLWGYKTLSKSSVIKTVAGILFLSLFLEITSFIKFSEDIFVSAVFGGILTGAGVGLAVLFDASTGGSDFAAIMLNKRIPSVSVTNFILAIDCVIIVLMGVAFKNYTIMFYSAISLYISTKVTNFILVRGDYAKSVFIITQNRELLAKDIMEDMQRGVTGIYSKGMYKDEDTMILMCVVKSRELPRLLEKVKNADKNAFTIVSEVREVLGEGFK